MIAVVKDAMNYPAASYGVSIVRIIYIQSQQAAGEFDPTIDQKVTSVHAHTKKKTMGDGDPENSE